MDANGVFNVTAKDMGTQQRAEASASKGRRGMTKEEIEKMKRDAESARRRRQEEEGIRGHEERGGGEPHLRRREGHDEAGDKITESDKSPSERRGQKVQRCDWSRHDLPLSRSATSELDTASNAMAKHVYSKVARRPGTGQRPSSSQDKKDGGDDVVDAEYEVKK